MTDKALKQANDIAVGVDVTKEGTHVVAMRLKPNGVNEVIYSQFHPLSQQEAKDEPLQSVWNTLPSNKDVEDAMRMKRLQQLSTSPQRTPITDEDIRQANHHMVCGAYDYSFKQGVRWAEKVHGIKWEWEK